MQNARAVWGESSAQVKAIEEILTTYRRNVGHQAPKDMVDSRSDGVAGRFATLALGK